MRLIHALNLTAGLACLVIVLNLIVYGSIELVEPNVYVLAAELVLAAVTVTVNVREVMKGE